MPVAARRGEAMDLTQHYRKGAPVFGMIGVLITTIPGMNFDRQRAVILAQLVLGL